MKKAPSDKRAVLPRASDRTKAFVKDWNRIQGSGAGEQIIFVRAGTHADLFE